MDTLKKYIKIWWSINVKQIYPVLSSQWGWVIFLLGKVIRFSFYFYFMFFLVKNINSFAGYDLNQTLFFFITFTLIDTISQFFFREVYRFRPLVVSGGFDLVLTKPVNSLFRILLGGADAIDMLTIPPLLFLLIYFGEKFDPTILESFMYFILIINSLLISMAFHIFVLALGIITLEIDHTIMIYRDLASLGRFPIDIYKQPLKGLVTYLIPIGIMVTFPAKVLMGIFNPLGIIVALLVGVVVLFISFKFWGFALKFYTSASS